MSQQPSDTSISSRDYDLFVSYSHQDSAAVNSVLDALKKTGLVVFDSLAHHEKEMWGRDLRTWFAEVFPSRARAAMIFLSKHYNKSAWCNKELDYLLGSVKENPSFIRILPIRLDNAEVPAQANDLVFLDIANTSPEEIAALTKARIKYLEDTSKSDLAILSDEELIQRIAAERDNEAFDVLYKRIYPTILRYIRSYFASLDREETREVATEIVGDVLVKLWEQAARFPHKESSFDKWLAYLTNRSIVEHERKKQRGTQDIPVSLIQEPDSSMTIPINPITPAAVLEATELMDRAMEGLSNNEREFLQLYLEGMTFREIADTLDISHAESRYRMNKLLARLRYRIRHLERAS